jgi:antitoxin component of MazEF toxin-antitoxin module
MASETGRNTHYIGKVLPNGYLEIPKTIVEHMGLKNGDEVVVVLHKVTAAGVSLPAEAQTLIQELVGAPSSLKETVEALTTIATEMMPHKQQRRLSHLLWKNQDGVITAKEEAELDTLVAAGQQATLRKAKALLALKHLGIDIMPALEAQVRSASG